MPSETTIAKKPVRRTTFPNGTFSYEVDMFVTPALMVSFMAFRYTVELNLKTKHTMGVPVLVFRLYVVDMYLTCE